MPWFYFLTKNCYKNAANRWSGVVKSTAGGDALRCPVYHHIGPGFCMIWFSQLWENELKQSFHQKSVKQECYHCYMLVMIHLRHKGTLSDSLAMQYSCILYAIMTYIDVVHVCTNNACVCVLILNGCGLVLGILFFFFLAFFLVCGLCASFLSSSRGVVGWCFCGGVVVFLWWCLCGDVFVVVW